MRTMLCIPLIFALAGCGSDGGSLAGYGKPVTHLVHVEDHGATPNDLTDDTEAIALAAAALGDNDTLVFKPGIYLVSSPDATAEGDFGKSVISLTGRSNIAIHGDRTVIKTTDHDISADGGLTFFHGHAIKGLLIDGLTFDMTFTGVNESSALYPYCGAIVVSDGTASGTKDQSALSGNIIIRNCTFKLFHPLGQYAVTTSPYYGDHNNGFKLFSIFLNGDYLGASYESQNRNASIEDCHWLDGHNGYGSWVWAYNHVNFTGLTAESWVGKKSLTTGSVAGTGVGFIRYHQFNCSGVEVSGCDFRARPSAERTDGFEGAAVFAALDTNLTGDHSHGSQLVYGNRIALSNGDAVNSCEDYGVIIGTYGNTVISGNAFSGTAASDNGYGATGIYANSQAMGGNGVSSLTITGNAWDSSCSYQNSIVIANGSNTSAYHRRIKSLVVANNISHSQSQYFLSLTGNSWLAHMGVQNCLITGNIVSGTANTQWNAASLNSRTFLLSATEDTDVLEVTSNQITDKCVFGYCATMHSTAEFRFRNNRLVGVTYQFIGGSFTNYQDP